MSDESYSALTLMLMKRNRTSLRLSQASPPAVVTVIGLFGSAQSAAAAAASLLHDIMQLKFGDFTRLLPSSSTVLSIL
jgi:hypothetical protein